MLVFTFLFVGLGLFLEENKNGASLADVLCRVSNLSEYGGGVWDTYTLLVSQLLDDTILGRADDSLHLHGLDDDKRGTLLDSLALLDLVLENLARHGGGDGGANFLEAESLLVPARGQKRELSLDAVLEDGDLGIVAILLGDNGRVDALLGEMRVDLGDDVLGAALGRDVGKDLGGLLALAADGNGVQVVARLGNASLDDLALVGAVAVEDLEGKLALAGGVGGAKAERKAMGTRLVGLEAQDTKSSLGKDLTLDVAGLEELVSPLLDEASLDVALDEGGGLAEALEKLDVGAEADNLKLAESAGELGNGSLAVVTADNELGNHAVVGLGDDTAGTETPVQTDILVTLEALGENSVDKLARVGHEALFGVLGVDTGLDGGAALGHLLLNLGLVKGKLLARGNAELPLDQVDTGNHLSDGVLDLETGVHLHEVELAAVLVEDKLNSTGTDVADSRGGHAGLVPEILLGGSIQIGGGGLFEDLLVSALDTAVTLAESDGVAVLVGKDLDLDVAGADNVLFDEHDLALGAERSLGLGAGALELGHELILGHDNAHTLATTTADTLEQDGESNVLGVLEELLLALVGAVVAGDAGDVGGVHNLLGAGLVAHVGHGRGRGPDEDDALLLAALGELGVLRQESVARVEGLDAVLLGEGNNLLAVEVALGPAEAEGLEAGVGVPRVGVDVGVDGGGADAHALGRLVDSDGNLAAVGDEDGLDGGGLGGARGGRGGISREGPQREAAVGSEGTHGAGCDVQTRKNEEAARGIGEGDG